MRKIFTLFLTLAAGLAVAQTNLPVDFEGDTTQYVFNDFEGGVADVIDNPDPSGINTSATVGRMIKFEGAVFGGSTLVIDGSLDFGDSNAISMKVWANRVGAPILFKLEGDAPTEVSMATTVANQWEELVFSFAGLTGANYTGITLIYDLGVVGDGGPDFTFYFDDMVYTNQSGGVTIPIDFESTELTYVFNDFEGGFGSVIDNPDPSGINTSMRVGQMIKFEGAVFAGSTLTLGEPPVFGNNNAIKMKVWANRVDAPILFKFEGPAPVERTMTTTAANEWHELVFDFTGATAGVYTGITIIYDLGVVGDGSSDFTLFFDDIEFAKVAGNVVELPLDFESTETNYPFADFDGGMASVIDNPDASGVNTSARVGRMIKNAGADFAGSTLSLTSPVDFGNSTKITMKTWMNRVGAPILLKLEGSPAVEVSMSSTVANQWEELEFEFAGMPINSHSAITLIYDLGVVGDGSADFTMYFDDIAVAGTSAVVELEELGIQYFPNPTSDRITVTAENTISSISIYNMMGQQVIQQDAFANQSIVDVSSLNSGTYVMKVVADGRTGASKIVKK